MSKVRRASIQENHDFQLSTRTRKSISKSRRSSLAEEMIKPSTSSRRNSFAALMNSIQPIEEPTMDVHKIYKKRVNKSFHKLNCFFGEPTPVDVCICEIKKEGLKAILESKVPLCYFLYYLLDEHSSENLFFFLEIEQFEKASLKDQKETVHSIYNTFISNKAELQVNLDDKVRRNMLDRLSMGHDLSTLFQHAKMSIYNLLETSFMRFLDTKIYQEMMEQCGELTIHYGEPTVQIALDYLYKYLKQQKKNMKSLEDESFVRHYDLIKKVIEKFDEIIKQGLVLCTRTEQWYAKKRTRVKEIKLRKTRLRWRQFQAILRTDRLDLYHSTTIKTNRLAHTIYFNPQPPLRPVRLSLVSPLDCIWSLEYTHSKHLISFHFQSCRLSDAKAWYQSIYQRLSTKKPIPSYIDVTVRKEPSTIIRIPLDYFRKAYRQPQEEPNLSFKHIQSALSDILYSDDDASKKSARKEWKLCWTVGDYVETIDEKDSLIGYQLIEQIIYEGLLIRNKATHYTILFGNQLLFLDDYYYTNTPNPKNTWFSVTSGLILRNTNRLKKKIKHLNFSAPQLISSFTIPPPPPSKLAYTKSALDLSQVESVDRSEDRMIEIRLKNKQTLSFKVPDTQCQIEWISLIRKRLLQIHHNLNDLEPSDHIILSSVLYVKKNYSRHYLAQYCVLVKNAKESCLLLFDTRSKDGGIYQKRKALLDLQTAYIYTGYECVLDQLVRLENSPACYYPEGITTGNDRTSDCVFVIWQLAKRHFVSDLRESLSLLKLGHRLGQKGTCWIFKTKNRAERDRWLSALHKEWK
ncbi:hypothetical protein G6F57_000059 [Rhizopus arrhizus]|uniref:RGS domain-containing protein n=1 Tax=Rhizopus oryzae TaxID=64495 RepID=A0A9P7BTB6_RHIOR|nr:hypothetical protein G6F65_005613 [Rhizopus arrhizus]KAG1414274.1 hypothetical protein G6F58_007033 [Rhizopus delemar]KAG1309308.1 hypothetical protein G6F64_005417 [Rhizopus arrhizus]KAG1384340.1 hypothetical protein G6F61_000553 [Rhizopus arrhizus]KAG1401086.1 hypothetical protein G6F60_006627 [Rhizopus arrhizus]